MHRYFEKCKNWGPFISRFGKGGFTAVGYQFYLNLFRRLDSLSVCVFLLTDFVFLTRVLWTANICQYDVAFSIWLNSPRGTTVQSDPFRTVESSSGHYYVFRRLLVSVDLWHYNIGIYTSLKSNILSECFMWKLYKQRFY